MAQIAAQCQLFGGVCTEARVLKEFSGYSDFQLHCFAHNHAYALGAYMMPPTCVMASAKFVFLADLLAQLKEKGGWKERFCTADVECVLQLLMPPTCFMASAKFLCSLRTCWLS